MNWIKVTDLCIKSGEWRIYRYPLAVPERFELWRLEKLVGNFRTSAEAKAAAVMSRKAA
jgi:hypothetical protein